jgi:hypothetical protein
MEMYFRIHEGHLASSCKESGSENAEDASGPVTPQAQIDARYANRQQTSGLVNFQILSFEFTVKLFVRAINKLNSQRPILIFFMVRQT